MRLFSLCMIACIGLAASRSINSLESLEEALIDGDLKCIDKHENIIKKYLLTKENCDSLRVPDFRLKTSAQRFGERVKRQFGRKASAGETDPEAPQVVAKDKGFSLFRNLRRPSNRKRSGDVKHTEFSLPLNVISRKMSKSVVSPRDRKREKAEEATRIKRSPRHKLVSPFGSSASLKKLEELDAESQVHSQHDLGNKKGDFEAGEEKKEGKKEDEEVIESAEEKKNENAVDGSGVTETKTEPLSPGIEGDDIITFVHATLLHHAVAAGAAAIVEACLELGADPNVLNIYEETPLFAVRDSNFELVNLLLKYGALPNVLNVDQETPLLSAASSGNELVAIELVVAGLADVTLTGQGKFSALAWAAQLQEWDLVYVIAKAGANVNVRVMGGRPVLHLAVRACRADVVQILLEHGADPNIINKEYDTPLHILMYRVFEEFEADIEEDYDEGYFWNPAVRRARRRHFNLDSMKILQMLLEAGANRNIRNFKGYTPEQIGNLLHREKLVARLKGITAEPSSDDTSASSVEHFSS